MKFIKRILSMAGVLAISLAAVPVMAANVSDPDGALPSDHITLEYDDVYDTGLRSITSISEQSVTSYSVENGAETDQKDAAVLTICGSGSVRVTGTGTAVIRGKDEKDRTVTINVTAEPATLTVMFLNGQSNAEGMISLGRFAGAAGQSIACNDGEVYSTYISQYDGTKYNNLYPGVHISTLISGCDTVSYREDPDIDSRMPSSLASYDTNMEGGVLAYPLNALTESGNGKTGPDSGLAYEWNKLTGDKVWVVNTAYSKASIVQWQPGGDGLTLTEKAGEYVDQLLDTEISAGHYILNKRLDVWIHGETDTQQKTDWYLSKLVNTERELTKALDLDYFGIVTTRRCDTTDNTAAANMCMTGMKNADYIFDELHGDSAGIVSNVNELWVTDSDVRDYFTSAVLSYPVQDGTVDVPETTSDIHGDEHFSQIAHNENGISAAKGFYDLFYGRISADEDKDSGFWMDAGGTAVTTLNVFTDIPTALRFRPGSTTDKIIYSASSDAVTYDPVYGTVIISQAGICQLTAYNFTTDKTYTVKLNVTNAPDGLHKIMYTLSDRKWYCTKKGRIHAYDVVRNSAGWWYVDGKGTVDFTYNGIASNAYGYFKITNGKVTFRDNGVIKVGNYWYYLVKSRVTAGPTVQGNAFGWWYIDRTGRVNFGYSGIAPNAYGRWYCKNGKVQFGYTGKITWKGRTYNIVKGKVKQ